MCSFVGKLVSISVTELCPMLVFYLITNCKFDLFHTTACVCMYHIIHYILLDMHVFMMYAYIMYTWLPIGLVMPPVHD